MSDPVPRNSITVLEPWVLVRERGQNLEQELRKEIVSGHPLYARSVRAIAQRTDCDDVLFEIDSGGQQYAVVHLTWAGKPAHARTWPDTRLYSTWEQWVEQCMKPDHLNFFNG